jgi:hypothetical protein
MTRTCAASKSGLRHLLVRSGFKTSDQVQRQEAHHNFIKQMCHFNEARAQADEKAQHTWKYVSPAIGGKEACDAPLKYYQ